MKKINDNFIFQYVLIACLGVALLFGQMFKLHMHIQHADKVLNASAGHVVNVHASSSLHNTTHHQDDFQDHHNNADIEISSDGFLKVSKVLSIFVFLLFVVSFILSIPLLQRIRKTDISQLFSPIKYYLLHAPLRAPPI